jgi:hypothetical protein
VGSSGVTPVLSLVSSLAALGIVAPKYMSDAADTGTSRYVNLDP